MNDATPRPQAKIRKALTPLLEIRNLTKSFDGQHAVDDVNLTIYKVKYLLCSARPAVANRHCCGCWRDLNCRLPGKSCLMASI